MNEVSQHWIPVFSDVFVSKILPYDSNLVFLTGGKPYDLYAEVFSVFFEGCKLEDADIADFKLKKLDPIVNSYAYNYAKALNEQLIGAKHPKYAYYELLINEHHYDQAVSEIEKELAIDTGEETISSDGSIPTFPDLLDKNDEYKKSLENVPQILNVYAAARNFLYRQYSSSTDAAKHTDDEFILFVSSSEAWNFLSHLAFAYSNKCYTERVFKSNFDRSLRHLARASLDIFKYLIIKRQVRSPDILSLRKKEIGSFGNSVKLEEVLQGYHEIVERHISGGAG